MYFPYLRGKQFELIALREIRDIMASFPSKISPIIEPVKISPTLKKVLGELASSNINFNVIINPVFGELINSSDKILDILASELATYPNYQAAIIIDDTTSEQEYLDLIRGHRLVCSGLTFIHNSTRGDIESLIDSIQTHFGAPVIYNVLNSKKTNRRYYRSFEQKTLVSLDDFFCCQKKNADYLSIGDSQFSEEHLYFSQDGYKGFSDFLTVGDNYSDGGSLPYAVAIHLSYADDKQVIRVNHFVSDSNSDTSDIGGKFGEALEKLIVWCRANPLNTRATDQFEELYQNGHFPGLGSIKKLSIMNHIELVLNLI